MERIDDRLRALGIALPPPPTPIANYVPAKRVASLAVTAGHVPVTAEGEYTGQLGTDRTIEEGQAAARACLLNCLASLLTVIDSLDRVVQLVRIDGLINSAPGFTGQAAVMNGASDLAVAIFGEAGRHVRTSAGVAGLPNNYTASLYITAEVQ